MFLGHYRMSSRVPLFVKAVTRDLRKIARTKPDLKMVTKIEIKFCPWNVNSESTKKVWLKLCSEKSRKTNPFCLITTKVLHDDSEPVTLLTFSDNDQLEIHGGNLLPEEILYHINSMCINKQENKTEDPVVRI